MFRNYLTIAWRNLIRNKVYSAINIGGLAVGMAVAMLIGLWVYDELSYNKYHQNYDRIAQLSQFVTFDGKKSYYDVLPIPLAVELRSKYTDFKAISLSKPGSAILSAGDNQFTKTGRYVEPDFLDMMSMKLIDGTTQGLADVNSILLSKSVADALFGTANPLNKLVKINDKASVRVTGVYEDFPKNSTFNDALFLAPWSLFLATNEWARNSADKWDDNSFQLFVQLTEGTSVEKVSAKIKDIRMKRENPPPYKPEFFLHPMAKWHLYADFREGVNTGGLIQFVWLFGLVGSFVLLLACINFMNLSTARSQKRAKEVGIRKVVGSVRTQLIVQFLSESLLVVGLSFCLALLLVQVSLPSFSEVADKQLALPWFSPGLWLLGFAFCLLTGLIAASYPALYLSSFQPIRVLKGIWSGAGRWTTVPRKVLVVFQYAVSVSLIIGTLIVLRQIQFAKDRPAGYSRASLIEIPMSTPALYGHYDPLQADLLGTGAVVQMSESHGSITVDYGGTTNLQWAGKAPDEFPLLMGNHITHDFGKTVGWQVVTGRDFSKAFTTDSSAVVLNESAWKLIGGGAQSKNPIGVVVTSNGKPYHVIGIVSDFIKNTPFAPVSPSFFILDYKAVDVVNLKLAAHLPTAKALDQVAAVFRKYNPEAPFEYTFVDDEYAKKFENEERIATLAGFFAILAIFISCLGLFGLASFMAEARTKEIGVRKVLGASVLNLWGLLSKDFVVLVVIAFVIATPIAWYFLNNWLQQYQYRTEISWWIFAVSGAGALIITLLTVSFQSIKAALMNPVKSLRSE